LWLSGRREPARRSGAFRPRPPRPLSHPPRAALLRLGHCAPPPAHRCRRRRA
jgi:hypothetical protein